MQKWIMTSTSYRQSSRIDPGKQAIDSANTLYWRMPLQRLDAESIRDRILATSGELNAQLYGPAAPIEEDTTGQVAVAGGVPRRERHVRALSGRHFVLNDF